LKRSLSLSALVVSALSLGSVLAGGCVVETSSSPEEAAPAAAPGALGGPHVMLTDQARAALPEVKTERARTKLTYFGGPVVQNVDVHPVFWNSAVQLQSNINAFYAAISTGPVMSFLSQYSTTSPAQTIGNGTSHAGIVDTQTATTLTDAQVQSYLIAAFNSGKLPKPNNNTYYPIHFPAGVSIALDSADKSCVQFCAYHGTGVFNGQDFYYGVLPDLSQAGCNGGCGGSTLVNNTTSVASHEFCETITDPAVGIATVFGPPLGWDDQANGEEIGDLCNGQQVSTVLGDGKTYTVQREWSNKTSTCAIP
jgi:hypothetical protein